MKKRNTCRNLKNNAAEGYFYLFLLVYNCQYVTSEKKFKMSQQFTVPLPFTNEAILLMALSVNLFKT